MDLDCYFGKQNAVVWHILSSHTVVYIVPLSQASSCMPVKNCWEECTQRFWSSKNNIIFTGKYEDCQEMIWIQTVFLANGMLWGGADYRRVLQSTLYHYRWPHRACLQLLGHYQVHGRNAKWRVIILGRDGPGGSYRRRVLNHEIFVAVYLRSLGRKRVHVALRSTVYGTLAVARKLYSQLSVTCVTTLLKNGTVKPSGRRWQ